MIKISIIIPIFNEAETIEKLLNHLIASSSAQNIHDIIVVDGGSTDTSKDIVSNFKNVILIPSEKGRAKQMNVGSKHANGEILYFLHADSFPPKNFDNLIIDSVEKGNYAGCFKMKFKSDHWWLKLAGWFTKFSWNICRGGDQSLFIKKSLFQDIGGFDERYIIYEDNIIIKKLYALNQFKVIQKSIITSARKYETHGVWKLQCHFFMIHLKHWFGANANELHSYYKKHIT
ncbi:TIGR04283 family arsenosugar biosynthesis glycosyltransferase [Yeosuana marina]|uniref:TIGR04283 family arsenosugar biosynthesis glycosyltransferase n=1 Tax=Yeosuana marina TaxID=1565536 RepID=UPI0030EE9626|tara:strand:+ start:887 stop:1579 length:693 start_codon:yes stop_codon:yes gene_type:complete